MKTFYQLKILFRRLMNELNPAAAHSSSGITFFRIFKLFTTRRGLRKFKRLAKKLMGVFIRMVTGQSMVDQAYSNWLKRNTLSEIEINNIKKECKGFSIKPKISLIIPVYNSNLDFIKKTIASVKNQYYSNWEICVSDDCSTKPDIIEFLKGLIAEKKIKVNFRKENGHISKNLNSALELATGEYVAFLDHDDEITPNALYETVKIINSKPDAQVIYSDEDKIGPDGKRFEPYFKPDWSPDTLLSRNYINHFLMVKKSLIDSVDGFRVGFEGAQDHDLLLRITEKTKEIYHIDKILYHWRFHAESTANKVETKEYALKAGVKAITEAYGRKGLKSTTKFARNIPGAYYSRLKIENPGMVSIIIPSKDKADVLKVCIESIIDKSSYTNFEIVLIDNNSVEESFFDLVSHYENKLLDRFKYISVKEPFNFSRLMNIGVENSNGEYIILLNNDTEVVTGDWMEAMMEQCQRNDIGAVGSRLLFPDYRLQHVGVIIGLGGTAGHAFVGKDDDYPGYFHSANLVTNYSAVTAACLMVKKELYNQVKGFDENLAVEYNDVDFCLKLLTAGKFNIYLPHVELLHYESLTRGHPFATKEGNERHIKESNYFDSKWEQFKKHDPFFNDNFNKDLPDYQLKV